MRAGEPSEPPSASEPLSASEPYETRDVYGRLYRVGESPEQIMGRPRILMLVLPWVAMGAVSVMQYGYGVAVPALREAHGWSLVQAFSVLAVWVAFQAGVGFPAAWLRRRRAVSPAWLMVAGGVLCLLGLVALGQAGNLAVALAGYGVVGGTGAGLVYATSVTTVSSWYPESRSTWLGAVTGAFAYGSLPFVVLFGLGMDAANAAGILTLSGLVVGVVVVGCGVLLSDPPPHWWPAHIDPQAWAVDRQLNRSLPENVPAVRQYSPGQVVRSGSLPVMYAILVSMAAVSLLGIASLASYATAGGFAAGVVVVAVGGLALVNGVGRTLAARISDRLGRRRTLAAVLAIEGLAQFGLVASAQSGLAGALVAFALLAGLGGGAFYPLFGSLVLEYFGEHSALENIGLVYSAKVFGGLIGIGAGAVVVTAYGFAVAFAAAGCLGVLAAASTRLLHQPGRPTLPDPGQRTSPANASTAAPSSGSSL